MSLLSEAVAGEKGSADRRRASRQTCCNCSAVPVCTGPPQSRLRRASWERSRAGKGSGRGLAALPCPDPRASSERAALFCTNPLPSPSLGWTGLCAAQVPRVLGAPTGLRSRTGQAPLSPPARPHGGRARLGGNAKPSSRPPSGRGRSSGAGAGSCLKRGARMGWGADRHG